MMRKKKIKRTVYKTQGYTSSKSTHIDTSTGEISYKYSNPCMGDINFLKVWLPPLIDALNLGNSTTKVLAYMLQNMDKRNNTVLITQKEIENDLSMSYSTINTALNKLKERNTIAYSNGIYRINPNFIFRGYNYQRNIVLNEFNKVKSRRSSQQQIPVNSLTKNIEFKRTPIVRDCERHVKNIKYQTLVIKATNALLKMNKK